MVKKLINLSQSDINFVQKLAKKIGDPRAVKGNFSKAVRYIVKEYKIKYNTIKPINENTK